MWNYDLSLMLLINECVELLPFQWCWFTCCSLLVLRRISHYSFYKSYVIGILVNDLKLIIAHGVGHVLSVFYCTQYIRYVTPGSNDLPGTVNQHKVMSFSIISLVLASFALFRREISREIVGWSSVVLSCLMYGKL